jgi:hypothetical protein
MHPTNKQINALGDICNESILVKNKRNVDTEIVLIVI